MTEPKRTDLNFHSFPKPEGTPENEAPILPFTRGQQTAWIIFAIIAAVTAIILYMEAQKPDGALSVFPLQTPY